MELHIITKEKNQKMLKIKIFLISFIDFGLLVFPAYFIVYFFFI